MKGIIKKLTDKNFGFITQEGSTTDLFFHASNLADTTFDSLNEGDEVEFEIVDTPKGQAAEQIRKVA